MGSLFGCSKNTITIYWLGCTLRSWMHNISTKIRTWFLGFIEIWFKLFLSHTTYASVVAKLLEQHFNMFFFCNSGDKVLKSGQLRDKSVSYFQKELEIVGTKSQCIAVLQSMEPDYISNLLQPECKSVPLSISLCACFTSITQLFRKS